MRSSSVECIVRIAACLIAGFLASLAFTRQPEAVRAKPYGVEAQPQFAHTSAASCSASACHGGGQAGKLGSEHTTWAPELASTGAHDPHSKAFRSLFNEDSVRIAKLLGGGPAHENVLCLKCHAPAGITDRTARAEGVGCSACHGPSDKWLAEHYLPSWKSKSNHDKWTETGFVPTKNLVARVSNCASCHVGGADREVNHDLIAAGHPRLAFEYTRFHFQDGYRKHWEERTPQPDFEVRAWTISQAASVRAAVDVLHSRSVKTQMNKAPWPEFAGHSCYACHQSIGKGEPKAEVVKGRKLGLPGWEVWYTAAVENAAAQTKVLFPGASVPGLVKLAELKKLMADANPKPSDVEKLSAAALVELDTWLADLQASEEANPRSSRAGAIAENITLALTIDGFNDPDWDALASHYLGCASMYHATGGAKTHPAWKDPLANLHKELEFPRIGYNSPVNFDNAKVKRVRSTLSQFRDVLIEMGEKR